jgi:hypothetical protein
VHPPETSITEDCIRKVVAKCHHNPSATISPPLCRIDPDLDPPSDSRPSFFCYLSPLPTTVPEVDVDPSFHS